ncbi:TetR/AcrR family transcriptional regulator [Kribbella sp. NBC_01505]|uniref:TetR/AcrR family transcriptional regulator n=1 Tax=Kribbella sp. NBC_01505 TaxID=2903580 RepID=UPI003863B69A
MTSSPTDARRPRRRPGKREAILDGARTTFAREGYSRASIETIAAEAEVSSRTLYNHFGDKARLFEAVIQVSATEVAEFQLSLIEQFLGDVTDLSVDLDAFARAWAGPAPQHAGHLALVRHIQAEAGHLPPAVLAAWHRAGPGRVQEALAERLRSFAERGLLTVDDPEQAAFHLSMLITAEADNRSYRGAVQLPAEEVAAMASAGVRVFLRGYQPTE